MRTGIVRVYLFDASRIHRPAVWLGAIRNISDRKNPFGRVRSVNADDLRQWCRAQKSVAIITREQQMRRCVIDWLD